MKRIPLTKGKVALVDDCDYEYLMQWKWCYAGDNHNHACRTECENSHQTTVYMHQLVAARKGLLAKSIDHENLNGLNNTRGNLREATKSQNGANRGPTRRNTSGFKGVFWNRRAGRWMAKICTHGKQRYLGYFDSKIAAAKAYNDAAEKYFGEFAYLNKI